MTRKQRRRYKRQATLAQKMVTNPSWLQRRILQIVAEQPDLVLCVATLDKAFPGSHYPVAAARAVLVAVKTLVAAGLLHRGVDSFQLTATAWLKHVSTPSEAVRP